MTAPLCSAGPAALLRVVPSAVFAPVVVKTVSVWAVLPLLELEASHLGVAGLVIIEALALWLAYRLSVQVCC